LYVFQSMKELSLLEDQESVGEYLALLVVVDVIGRASFEKGAVGPWLEALGCKVTLAAERIEDVATVMGTVEVAIVVLAVLLAVLLAWSSQDLGTGGRATAETAKTAPRRATVENMME
jgi:hypothetical protein